MLKNLRRRSPKKAREPRVPFLPALTRKLFGSRHKGKTKIVNEPEKKLLR